MRKWWKWAFSLYALFCLQFRAMLSVSHIEKIEKETATQERGLLCCLWQVWVLQLAFDSTGKFKVGRIGHGPVLIPRWAIWNGTVLLPFTQASSVTWNIPKPRNPQGAPLSSKETASCSVFRAPATCSTVAADEEWPCMNPTTPDTLYALNNYSWNHQRMI